MKAHLFITDLVLPSSIDSVKEDACQHQTSDEQGQVDECKDQSCDAKGGGSALGARKHRTESRCGQTNRQNVRDAKRNMNCHIRLDAAAELLVGVLARYDAGHDRRNDAADEPHET